MGYYEDKLEWYKAQLLKKNCMNRIKSNRGPTFLIKNKKDD